MNRSLPIPPPFRAPVRAILLTVLSLPARADNLHFAPPQPPILGVTVTRLTPTAIYFRTSPTSPESSRPLSALTRLTIDRLPLLAQAESARTSNRPADAVELFGRLLATPTTPDITLYAAQRLAETARLTRRTDAATIAYVRLIAAGAQDVNAFRPTTQNLPPASAEPALALLRTALKQGSFDINQRTLLTSLEADLAANLPPTATPDLANPQSEIANRKSQITNSPPRSPALAAFHAALTAPTPAQRNQHLLTTATDLEAAGHPAEAALLRTEAQQP